MSSHPIFEKITNGTASEADFNKLIQESTPESVRDRVRRRTKRNSTDSHQDEEGHQDLELPTYADRVQPKRKPSGRSQMNGRGRVAHKHSAKTQKRTMPKKFEEAVHFIDKHIGSDNYDAELQLVEDKRALSLVATRMMSMPKVDRDWLMEVSRKCSTIQ